MGTRYGPHCPNGTVGAKRLTTGTPSAAARWAGPVLPTTSAPARATMPASSVRPVCPPRSRPPAAATRAVSSRSSGPPVTTTRYPAPASSRTIPAATPGGQARADADDPGWTTTYPGRSSPGGGCGTASGRRHSRGWSCAGSAYPAAAARDRARSGSGTPTGTRCRTSSRLPGKSSLMALTRRRPAIRSSSASGSADWWKLVNTTASSAPVAASRSTRRRVRAGSTGPASGSIHSSGHSTISSTPGSRSAAARPRGPHSSTTRSACAATARMPGPVTSTSPAESLRTTSTVPAVRGAAGTTARCRRRISSTAAVRVAAAPGAAATSSPRVTGVGTRMPLAPAASAAVMSRPMSPTTTHRAAVVPNCAAAACTRPGAGFRQPHPASSSCGHTSQASNGPSSSSTRACTRAICAGVKYPRARPDWFVTTASRRPAARSRSSAARAPGRGRTFSGSPLYGTSSISVPSRSSSTASNRTPPERPAPGSTRADLRWSGSIWSRRTGRGFPAPRGVNIIFLPRRRRRAGPAGAAGGRGRASSPLRRYPPPRRS
ncbi:hypothetical protein JD77_04397 [Micromonospora olivasterospora]|uniref:Uncharacterized protein n=1 Tax=Micromonospora olivasterospora TaxID=1880 RepID=A0A562IEY2_MICOL|nr:hypothetical protein JD77_04397 [Micromonospora olivasterospora]